MKEEFRKTDSLKMDEVLPSVWQKMERGLVGRKEYMMHKGKVLEEMLWKDRQERTPTGIIGRLHNLPTS
jgi:hypothetical protein